MITDLKESASLEQVRVTFAGNRGGERTTISVVGWCVREINHYR